MIREWRWRAATVENVQHIKFSKGLAPFAVALLVGSALPALATAAPYAFTLNGDRFVEMMSHANPSGYTYMLREKAYSYLDGVRDSSEGKSWCDVNQLKTPDLAFEIAAKIAKLPPSERKKNASTLLLEQLKREYPCPERGER